MKQLVVFLAFVFTTYSLMAQDGQIEMADKLYASGKIYIVVLAVLIILIGLLLYLIGLDRKLGKIEKELKSKDA